MNEQQNSIQSIEKILDDKTEDGQKLYFIKYKGVDYDHCTWGPIEKENMNSTVTRLIKEYEYYSFMMKKKKKKEQIRLNELEDYKVREILKENKIENILSIHRNENNMILAKCSFLPNSNGIIKDPCMIPTYYLRDICPLKLAVYYESRIKYIEK